MPYEPIGSAWLTLKQRCGNSGRVSELYESVIRPVPRIPDSNYL